jgi:hypothetical protein
MKTSTVLSKYNTVEDLVKGLENVQKMIGADKIPVPSKHATPDDWKNVYQKLGLAEKIEDYKLDIPKDTTMDKEFLSEFTKQAHANGILPHQAKALLEWYDKADTAAFDNHAKALQIEQAEQLKSLKKEWGASYGDEIAKAKAALNEFADAATQDAIRKAGLGNNVHIIKLLAKAGSVLSEDKILGQGAVGGVMTPSQATAEWNKISKDPNHPYWKGEHPEHQNAKNEVKRLFEMRSKGS